MRGSGSIIDQFFPRPSSGRIAMRFPVQEIAMFLEILPSEVADFVWRTDGLSPSSQFDLSTIQGRIYNDSLGFQDLNSAASHIERAFTDIEIKITKQQSLFLFVEGMATFYYLVAHPRPLKEINEALGEMAQQQGESHQEDPTKPGLVIICKLAKTKAFDSFWRAVKHESSEDGNYCQMTRAEFDQLQERIHEIT